MAVSAKRIRREGICSEATENVWQSWELWEKPCFQA